LAGREGGGGAHVQDQVGPAELCFSGGVSVIVHIDPFVAGGAGSRPELDELVDALSAQGGVGNHRDLASPGPECGRQPVGFIVADEIELVEREYIRFGQLQPVQVAEVGLARLAFQVTGEFLIAQRVHDHSEGGHAEVVAAVVA